MAMVLYKGGQALTQVPKAVQAAVLAATTLKQALSVIKQTKYYATQAARTKRAIEAEVRQLFPSARQSKASVAIGQRMVLNGPNYRPGKINGTMLISHREYLGDLSGSTTFGVVSYPINPGLGTTFPWLGGIANSYEKYRIKSMAFEFVNIAATSERGRVTLAVDYDVLDSVPTNKVDLFQISGASEGPIWEPLTIKVKPSELLFTRNGSLSNVDLKAYDAGRFIAAISNAADTSIKGELFVTYEVELSIPQPAKCPGTLLAATVSNWLALEPFKGAVLTGPLAGFSVVSNAYLQFERPGTYLIGIYISGTGAPGAISVTPSGGTEITYGTTSGGTSNYTSVFTSTVVNGNVKINYVSDMTNTTVRVFVAPFNNYTQ